MSEETPTESTPETPPDTTPEAPLLRVVKGDPTPEELAALVAVVSAVAAAPTGEAGPPRRSEWSAHHRKHRGAHRHGPGAWRASAR